MASEKILKQKQSAVEELSEKFKNAKVILFTDYRGINVEDVTKLRSNLRKANAEYKVIKNNITRRAIKENGLEGLDEVLTGTTAVIIGNEDYLAPSKAIYEFIKNNEFYKIKAGVIDGKVVSEEEVITLAKLPSREELLGKLAGVLLANIGKLAISLDQVRIQKESAQA